MESSFATLIMIFTGLTTYMGLKDHDYFQKYCFWVDGILVFKERARVMTSGFLHGGWWHYAFNMIALLSFSTSLEIFMGIPKLALVYFASLLGGSLLSLAIHRNHGDYRSIGASGAVSGVVFASIILFPEGKIGLIFLPFEFPNWIFAIAYILFSIFGIKHSMGNIGHAAHLGGALTGILCTMALMPDLAFQNQWILWLTLVPILGFLALVFRNPAVLLIEDYWGEGAYQLKQLTKKKPKSKLKVVHSQNIDQILDKINEKGIESLTQKEREVLENYKGEN